MGYGRLAYKYIYMYSIYIYSFKSSSPTQLKCSNIQDVFFSPRHRDAPSHLKPGLGGWLGPTRRHKTNPQTRTEFGRLIPFVPVLWVVTWDVKYGNILWMEEILHQLVDGLSHCNPIIYSVL